MDFKEQLLSEKKQLNDKLNAINLALKAYGLSDLEYQESDDNTAFPFEGSRERKIYWLFEHHFKRATKLPDLVAAYKKFAGTDVAIENLCRNLKSEGKLCYVKYNGRNKLCYWGLPDWVSIIDGKDFEKQFKPNDIPVEIYSSEIVSGK